MQPALSLARALAIVLLPLAILAADDLLWHLPDREEVGPRLADVQLSPVRMDAGKFEPLRLVGAWRVEVDDPRFGGVSGLAVAGETLIALTDVGVLVRLPKPGSAEPAALVDELPAGPRSGRLNRNRDSEVLLRDPLGRGWWVAFEQRDELWLYDHRFERPLKRIRLLGSGWGIRFGVEAMIGDGAGLLLVPERGRSTLRVERGRAERQPIGGELGLVSEAVRLADGRILLVERRPTATGFVNSLVELERGKFGYRAGARIRLPVSPHDNIEAVAVEARESGATRLWLMTDDNYQRPFRTLLVALDLPVRSE
jgi:hypothetical protein